MTIPHRTKPFKSGNSQAVRLPKALAFPEGTELEMVREGAKIVLSPMFAQCQDRLSELSKLPRPTSYLARDSEDLPEREGL